MLHKLFEYLSENKELILFLFHHRYAEQWIENAQAVGQKITIQSLKISEFPITDVMREHISIIVNGCVHRIARHLEQGEWDNVHHVLFSDPPDFNDDSVLSSGLSGSFSLMNSSTPPSSMKYLLENKTKHLILSV